MHVFSLKNVVLLNRLHYLLNDAQLMPLVRGGVHLSVTLPLCVLFSSALTWPPVVTPHSPRPDRRLPSSSSSPAPSAASAESSPTTSDRRSESCPSHLWGCGRGKFISARNLYSRILPFSSLALSMRGGFPHSSRVLGVDLHFDSVRVHDLHFRFG